MPQGKKKQSKLSIDCHHHRGLPGFRRNTGEAILGLGERLLHSRHEAKGAAFLPSLQG